MNKSNNIILEETEYQNILSIEKKIGKHPWTSHRAYMDKKQRPAWLHVDTVLGRFGQDEKEALKELHAFVQRRPPRALEKQLDSNR